MGETKEDRATQKRRWDIDESKQDGRESDARGRNDCDEDRYDPVHKIAVSKLPERGGHALVTDLLADADRPRVLDEVDLQDVDGRVAEQVSQKEQDEPGSHSLFRRRGEVHPKRLPLGVCVPVVVFSLPARVDTHRRW